ncbi:16S rRNA (guanine966-N2)-methyltransferase [Brevibacterium sanguinis]|uniref:16S rRNA (Guanine966-N2)-methyltransferase n=2 Tax=Brevibacterium TaxID=1696 RepID=A0A366INJ2_9MICO|nr:MULTISPECIES: 16S rRNA (guanine(966)-N(2))-methyltransferase RsmD [Brevibacterium]RBP67945.1 16S rRNA (guanine966-N2)-methyltransferase [Brevibacterium sanguinis]RBP74638.1 16S rRNA (guanine966-N2)-methyltransferase [Brevibacterium celere]
MRIIAGAHKGCRLVTPGGANTRPTSDRVKESLFSMLDGYGVVAAANVLDLFAGSGGLGLEAMSRGAAEADFVDSAAASARAIGANAQKMGVGHSVRIHTVDVITFLAGLRGRGAEDERVFDLVFMDPPYPLGEDAVTQTLGLVSGLLDEESIVVLERSTRSPEPTMPSGLEIFRTKAFGETTIHFVQLVAPGD